MTREWVVTLYRKEDLESFYEDMETPGGNLHIPNRAINVEHRREISRNTHYMLEDAEVELLKQDERVWDVTLRELNEMSIQPSGWATTNQDYHKTGWSAANGFAVTHVATHRNWGLLRHASGQQISTWGGEPSDTRSVSADLTVTASGKNVDVVIADGHIDPAHPEFAVNADGTGGSRVIQENWFNHGTHPGGTFGTSYPYSDNGSYVTATYAGNNNHGCHVGSTVAGNTQGWARDANIYNISPFAIATNDGTAGNPNTGSASISSFMWDYLRVWHNTKPVNAATGRKNPTIINCSFNSAFSIDSGNVGPITSINYRGTVTSGTGFTALGLAQRGIPTMYYPTSQHRTGGSPPLRIPYSSTSSIADMEDAIEAGIVVTNSSDNQSWKIVDSTDQDYNNTATYTIGGTAYTLSSHRGGGQPFSEGVNSPIVVGAMSTDTDEGQGWFSNIGNRVDVFAAGMHIQGSVTSNTYGSAGGADPRNSSYFMTKMNGTSMAAPQVCGVLACLAESWPNMTCAEARVWLNKYGESDLMHDTGADDPNDRSSLQGAKNLILRWFNQRPAEDIAFPAKANWAYANRPASGGVFPRSKNNVHGK
jgi:hypothetical protein